MRTISIEEVPQEYEEIKNLLRRISTEDLPTVELNDDVDSFGSRLRILFHKKLQQRKGEVLKKTLQDQFSTERIWDRTFEEFFEQVDSSSSTGTFNSIIHRSYSTQDQKSSTEVFAGFLMRVSIRLFQTQWFGILWELYHHDLDELESQFLRMYGKRDHDVRTVLKWPRDSYAAIGSLNDFSPAVPSLFRKKERDLQSRDELGFPQPDEFEIQKLKRTLVTKFGKPSNDSLNFSSFCLLLTCLSAQDYLENFPFGRVETATHCTTTRSVKPQWPLPSTIGLSAILESHLSRLDSKIDCMIENFFKDRTPTVLAYEGDSLPYPKQLETESFGTVHYVPTGWAFYAVPGCGKTRSIEILLSRNWGFIFTAGSLPVTVSDNKRSLASNSNIYDPRREGYSKDLHYLWKTINTCFQMFPGDKARLLRHQRFNDWSQILVYCRVLVFERFLSIAPHAEPADWLEFQRNYDPFGPLFWLFVLHSSSLSDHGGNALDASLAAIGNRGTVNVGQTLGRKYVTKMFVVLDEAQQDLDAKFSSELSPLFPGSKSRKWFGDNTMIQFLNRIQLHIRVLLTSEEAIDVTKIYSGTSLRLDEMMVYLEGQTSWDLKMYKVHSDFPLLRTEQEFRFLLNERKIDANSGFNVDELESIKRCSRRLRGRYLWSTLYIDEIRSRKSQGGILDEAAIEEVSDDVANRAKGDLKERLTRLHMHSQASQKTQKLLDHLCWIVVNCDLLDRPKTIALEEYEALVAQGFAIVSKESSTKGTLEESLAMEAALEWFRFNQPGLLRRKMHEVLQISVLDDSNLGNAAEWFLAFELYSLLQDQEDHLLGSLRLQRQERVLKQLFKAKPMFEPRNDLALDPENYRLVIGERIGYNFTGQSCRAPSSDSTFDSSNPNTQSRAGPLELWEYLRSLRDSGTKPRPTFYFPEHNAGPDLVFALEPINPTTDRVSERILCIVQLKTAGSGVNVQKAIMTTDLSQSYRHKAQERSGRLWPGSRRPLSEFSGLRRCVSDPSMSYDAKPDAMSKDVKSNHEKMKQELQNWEGRTVIRILIATQQESVSPQDIDAVKRKWDEVNKLNDYFVMFGKAPSRNNDHSGNQDSGAYIGDLFGDDFMSLLEQLKSKDTNVVIAARATPEEAEAKKEERKAKREEAAAQDSLDDAFGGLFG